MLISAQLLSRVQVSATPGTVAHQAPLSMGFSRQEYWSGVPFPSPGDLPVLGTELASPALQADSLPLAPPAFSDIFFRVFTDVVGLYFILAIVCLWHI